MRAVGRYDGELQMFVDEPREPNYEHLRFLRWLVEHGQLEHSVAGPPPGPGRRGGLSSDDEVVPAGSTRRNARPYPNLTCVPPWFGR
jgi:hypothetical protein